MSGKIIGENVEFRIEVEDSPKSVLLVLDRKCDWCFVPWDDAVNLADVIEQVIADVKDDFTPTLHAITVREQAQIQLNYHKGLVAIMVEWTDRVRFTSLDALYLFSQALRKVAQDAMYELRGTKFVYDKQGLLRKIINFKAGTEQKVR